MRICLNPVYEMLRPFVESLPRTFPRSGRTLHAQRNTVKAFRAAGIDVVVKRYKRPDPLHAFIYTYFVRSKARRAYTHAERLLAAGIDTPRPVAWCERHRRGVLTESYLVTLRTDSIPLSQAAARFPEESARQVIDAFARFAVRLHEAGIEHQDFNHANILYRPDAQAADGFRFQLIDINRMRFHDRPLSMRRCMVNLRRLSCPAPAFVGILDRYAELRGWNMDDTLLRGIFFRLLFLRRKRLKKRFRQRRAAAHAKKRGGSLD